MADLPCAGIDRSTAPPLISAARTASGQARGAAARSSVTRIPDAKRYAMTESSHAAHRWPVAEDPSQAWRTAPTKLDRFYPEDDIVAVIGDRSTAERAVQALTDAGVSQDDVDLVDGDWFVKAARSVVERRGVVKRLTHRLPTDESELARRYVEEAEQGHIIVVVHAPDDEEIDRACEVLAAHRAREMHHYGRRVIRDL